MTIANQKSDPITQMIRQLEDSPFDFYLTGSRFFQNPNHDSDWDFFVQDSKEVHQWLLKRGFRTLSHAYVYRDKQTLHVFRFRHYPLIDVQCVHDVRIKRIAQEIIRVHPESVHKSVGVIERTQVWNRAFICAERIMGM